MGSKFELAVPPVGFAASPPDAMAVTDLRSPTPGREAALHECILIRRFAANAAIAVVLAGASAAGVARARGAELDHSTLDRSVAEWLVDYSRRHFEGSCACPDDVDADGQMCGRRSFYALNGSKGYLFCYVSDVSPSVLKTYRFQD